MGKRPRILTILFGHIGDTLMALALFDDILSLDPTASFLILTRRNASPTRELAAAYPTIEVREIPSGLKSLPFFIKLLSERWIFLALGLGSAAEYSIRLKLFLCMLSKIPGNRSVGLEGPARAKGRWQPVTVVIKSDRTTTISNNFRSLLPCTGMFDEKSTKNIGARPLTLKLNTRIPQGFPYKPGNYIVAHLFGVSRYRSFPLHRWKSLFASIAYSYPNMPILFTGSVQDKMMIDEVIKIVPDSHAYIGLPLLEVGGIINGAALYIGVDTGITHLAGVLKQKSLIIRHVGDPRWIPTYNPHARILVNTKRCTCLSGVPCSIIEDGVSYAKCMYDISDKAILDSVKLALSSSKRDIPSFAGLKDEYHHL